MLVISVELTILVLVSLAGVSLDHFRPLNKFFMLYLHKHLGDGSVRGGNTISGRGGGVRGHLSLDLRLESRSDLLFFTSSL